MIIKKYIMFIILIIIIILVKISICIIPEGKIGLLFRLGKIKKKSYNCVIYNPGLYFKIPYIDKIKILDSKIQNIQDKSNILLTLDKNNIILDLYIQWKINDYYLYDLYTGSNKFKIEKIIKNKINNILKLKLKKLNLKDIIISEEINNNLSKYLNYNFNNKYDKKIINDCNIFIDNELKKYNLLLLGIKIIDIKIKNIILPKKCYEKRCKEIKHNIQFISDFNKLYTKIESEKLKAETNKEIKNIFSKTKEKILIIKGKTDLEINKMFINAFKDNIDFYIFIKNLKVYEKIFFKNNILILNSNNKLFNILNN